MEKKVPRFSTWDTETLMRSCCTLVDGACSDGKDDVDCDDCLFYDSKVSHAQRREFKAFIEECGLFKGDVK